MSFVGFICWLRDRSGGRAERIARPYVAIGNAQRGGGEGPRKK
jgi:hypothetical protein